MKPLQLLFLIGQIILTIKRLFLEAVFIGHFFDKDGNIKTCVANSLIYIYKKSVFWGPLPCPPLAAC